VLEYGVGTGRIAIPLARAGIDVTGVDYSQAMLSGLREKLDREEPDVRKRVRIVRGDMRRVRIGRRFPLIVAPFNAILHLYERSDVEQFLQRVRSHLGQKGRFVFDFSLPRADNLGADPNRRYGAPRFRHPGSKSLVRYGERFHYDQFRQVLLISMEFSPEDGSAPWTVPLAHRQFFPREIEALLHYNGFSDLRWFADFTDQPPGPDTDFVVVNCGAAP
jgi:SAM-dependent methyltransferase